MRRVGELAEAMLLAPVLKPIVAGADLFGEYELDALALDIARRDRHGFADLIASRLGHEL
jgi:hypothetical protein